MLSSNKANATSKSKPLNSGGGKFDDTVANEHCDNTLLKSVIDGATTNNVADVPVSDVNIETTHELSYLRNVVANQQLLKNTAESARLYSVIPRCNWEDRRFSQRL